MEPLISIVIPTRNRQKYCIAAIEDILSHNYPKLQLCIQDNSDDNEIERYISNRQYDDRLIYKYIPNQIASVFNIGGSLDLATGKYVILIGDDDTILPSLFSAVEYMDENSIESLCPIPMVHYFWPGAHPVFKEGYLIIPPQIVEYTVDNNVNEKLITLFKNGTINYLSYYLPKVYHGIIKRDILQTIKKTTGYYAGGLSPDIYLSVSISSLVKSHATCNYSISIAGACNQSATSQNANNGHKGELSDAPHFYLRGDYVWDSKVPSYYSVDTIWAESALKAATEMNLSHLSEKFNSNYLAAYSLLYNRSIFKTAYKHTFAKKDGLSFLRKAISISFYSIVIYSSSFYNKITRRIKRSPENISYTDVHDISNAVRKVLDNS